MKTWLLLSVSMVTSLVAFAHSNAPCPTEIVGSCMIKKNKGNACMDLLEEVQNFPANCEKQGGTYSPTPCNKDGVVGSCLLMGDAGGKLITRFYPPIPASAAGMICRYNKGELCD